MIDDSILLIRFDHQGIFFVADAIAVIKHFLDSPLTAQTYHGCCTEATAQHSSKGSASRPPRPGEALYAACIPESALALVY